MYQQVYLKEKLWISLYPKYILSTECKDLSGKWRSSDGHTVTFNQEDCSGTTSDGLKYIIDGVTMTINNGIIGTINSAASKITCSNGVIYIQGNFSLE